jgi:hypothetical protein
MPFDDNDSEDVVKAPSRKIGLKKTNTQQQINKTEVKAKFEQQADEQFAKIEDYKQQMWDLSVKYKSFIESKVLSENKGPISLNLEKEVLDKLVQLAIEMNEDATQPEGVGNTALCMLLMKCMLLQRDTINSLSFKLDQLGKIVGEKK